MPGNLENSAVATGLEMVSFPLSLRKEARIYNGEKKNILFNRLYCENWSTTCKRIKLEHFLIPYTHTQLKMDKRYKCKIRNYKTPRGKHRQNTHSRILYDPLPRVMGIKAKINKWDLIKLEGFCTMKERISNERQCEGCEKTAFTLGENNSKQSN